MVRCSDLTQVCLQAQRALARSPIGELRLLRVEETTEGVVLLGVVSRYYFKQLAQELVLPFCEQARCQLINRVFVRPREQLGARVHEGENN
ncbi:MAG: hypothetical protein NZ899_09125 [Thermoguttaceae bacterium]|nr:hypothetical protein [Thermoguttaceae bacterium]MDW8079874.1 hypothetical protein [Thermoguttaceae bacterium]